MKELASLGYKKLLMKSLVSIIPRKVLKPFFENKIVFNLKEFCQGKFSIC